jgi:hypothetical protein
MPHATTTPAQKISGASKPLSSKETLPHQRLGSTGAGFQGGDARKGATCANCHCSRENLRNQHDRRDVTSYFSIDSSQKRDGEKPSNGRERAL